MAVEDKQGISRLEQVVEEISEAERAKELKKEHKRLKKKKRKENKCKFANEMAEKKEVHINGHENDSPLGKENGTENDKEVHESKIDVSSKEEKPKCDELETDINGTHECEKMGNGKENVQPVLAESEGLGKCTLNDKGTNKDFPLKENCYCGDDAKEKAKPRKNGFINASEEKPHSQYKKAKGLSPNGYLTPGGCSSCGQQLSPKDRYDRGKADLSNDAACFSEICPKCAAMNSEAGGRRSRKKNKPKEVSWSLYSYLSSRHPSPVVIMSTCGTHALLSTVDGG